MIQGVFFFFIFGQSYNLIRSFQTLRGFFGLFSATENSHSLTTGMQNCKFAERSCTFSHSLSHNLFLFQELQEIAAAKKNVSILQLGMIFYILKTSKFLHPHTARASVICLTRGRSNVVCFLPYMEVLDQYKFRRPIFVSCVKLLPVCFRYASSK